MMRQIVFEFCCLFGERLGSLDKFANNYFVLYSYIFDDCGG